MNSASTRNGLYLDIWGSRHSGAVSIMEQSQEEGLKAGHRSLQKIIWNVMASSGSIAGRKVGGCWKTTLPMELCGRNKSEDKFVGIKQ